MRGVSLNDEKESWLFPVSESHGWVFAKDMIPMMNNRIGSIVNENEVVSAIARCAMMILLHLSAYLIGALDVLLRIPRKGS